MLRAEELRIGNLVYNKHGECHEIGYNCFQRFRYPTMDNNPSGFRPIELTEDVLLKCGFEKEGVTFRFSNYILWLNTIEPDYSFMLYDNRDENLHDYIVYSKPLVDIRYLHQLQNIIFALTGKELEVKL